MSGYVVSIILATTLLWPVSVASDGARQASGPSDQGPAALTDSQQIIDELRAIRQLLQDVTKSRPTAEGGPPQTAKVRGLQGYSLGSSNAPLTLVEFSDLECPFCRDFAQHTFPRLQKDWIDTGKLRYVSRDLPLTALHQNAMGAANATRCAGDQGKFWEMRRRLFVEPGELSGKTIERVSAELGLNDVKFRDCFATAKHQDEIQRDVAEANRLGLRGTPVFVLGRPKDDALDGMVIIGAQPYTVFDANLRRILTETPE